MSGGLEETPAPPYIAGMSEPDNLVLAHLRELRADMNARFDGVEGRLDEFEQRLDRVEKRLDQMHRNGMLALKNFIGHRTMTERAMASFDDEVRGLRQRIDTDISDLKRRVEQLEAAR